MNHEDTKNTKQHKDFVPLSPHEEWLAEQIVDAAYQVHLHLGPGLLESVYEKCFCYELEKRGIPFQCQKKVGIFYDGEFLVEEGLRLDLLVDDLIVVELKAQDVVLPVWDAQVLSYLRLCRLRLGFRINFHVRRIANGIKRLVI
jgi:GxxExxY protein